MPAERVVRERPVKQPPNPRQRRPRTHAPDALELQIAQLRALAEDPRMRPSVRVQARTALKLLVPPAPRRVAVEPDGRGWPAEPPDWPT